MVKIIIILIICVINTIMVNASNISGGKVDIYINHPYPVINQTKLFSGGSLYANTTFYFQCVFTAGYRGYYGMDCFSGMSEEFNITTNDTHRKIELNWGYINSSGVYTQGYPYPMVNILCRFDTQSFKNSSYPYGYFEWNRQGNDSLAGHPNWTNSAYYGGLIVYSGNARNLSTIGIGSSFDLSNGGTGIKADNVNIPYFAKKSWDTRNLTYAFNNIRNGSICIWLNSSESNIRLIDIWKEKVGLNITPGDRMNMHCDQHSGAYCMLDLYGSFIGNGNLTLYWDVLSLYDHSLNEYTNLGRSPFIIVNYSTIVVEKSGTNIIYYSPRMALSNSMSMNKVGAIIYGNVISANNNNLHLVSSTPSKYYTGGVNYQWTGIQGSNVFFNDRYPVSNSSYLFENQTFTFAYLYISHSCDPNAFNKSWNRSNIIFYNRGYTCPGNNCIQDIRFEDTITSCGNTSWFLDNFYNTYSYRNNDGIPIVRHANYTTNPNATQIFYNKLRILFINNTGLPQSNISVRILSTDGTITTGYSNVNGTIELWIPEYKTWFNKTIPTFFTSAMNLTPAYVNISRNNSQINGFYYTGYGSKEWILNTDMDYCPVRNTYQYIDIMNDAIGGLIIR